MNRTPTPSLETLQNLLITVPLGDRWLVRDRLQELDIPCQCESDGSLRVDITSPWAAIQVWSVLFRWKGSRQEHVNWLMRSWLGH
ncbi:MULTISPECIES: Asr1405/Asl0597 family protein [unclassified Leptolyngbya]|uniref:Asr1405/Asl0597 family protein n=1 Tax=unclassified Leptolyngbya TaxID=2650499 RepID=UPI0016836901|nr:MULTISPECIES: Asr1405/Asl0597 family protein [unclassified Leptolyngbya]MBD1910101.1 hypothetical protein [Leptolyngbya sp. FACHB-8]MBD2156873.1 hypothetical protein [Leptolyngbya sp. FACHB-16]